MLLEGMNGHMMDPASLAWLACICPRRCVQDVFAWQPHRIYSLLLRTFSTSCIVIPQTGGHIALHNSLNVFTLERTDPGASYLAFASSCYGVRPSIAPAVLQARRTQLMCCVLPQGLSSRGEGPYPNTPSSPPDLHRHPFSKLGPGTPASTGQPHVAPQLHLDITLLACVALACRNSFQDG